MVCKYRTRFVIDVFIFCCWNNKLHIKRQCTDDLSLCTYILAMYAISEQKTREDVKSTWSKHFDIFYQIPIDKNYRLLAIPGASWGRHCPRRGWWTSSSRKSVWVRGRPAQSHLQSLLVIFLTAGSQWILFKCVTFPEHIF